MLLGFELIGETGFYLEYFKNYDFLIWRYDKTQI